MGWWDAQEEPICDRSPGLLSLRGACDEAGTLSDQTPRAACVGREVGTLVHLSAELSRGGPQIALLALSV